MRLSKKTIRHRQRCRDAKLRKEQRRKVKVTQDKILQRRQQRYCRGLPVSLPKHKKAA